MKRRNLRRRHARRRLRRATLPHRRLPRPHLSITASRQPPHLLPHLAHRNSLHRRLLRQVYSFTAAVGGGAIWLAIIGLLNSGLAAAYYLRLAVVAAQKPDPDKEKEIARAAAPQPAVALPSSRLSSSPSPPRWFSASFLALRSTPRNPLRTRCKLRRKRPSTHPPTLLRSWTTNTLGPRECHENCSRHQIE